MAKIKKLKNPKVDECIEQLELSYPSRRGINSCKPILKNHVTVFNKAKPLNAPCPSNSLMCVHC